MKSSTRCLLGVAAIALLATSISVAQTTFGTLTGLVTDPAGALVPGAEVKLTNLGTGVSRSGESSEDGFYTFANIAPGTYDIAVSKSGFGSQTKRATVSVAQRLRVDFTLTVAAVAETVVVTESGVAVDTESGQLSTLISSEQVVNLPSLFRNPYAFVTLTPGASDTGAVTGDTRGLGLAINGMRTSSINFLMDGGENNNTFVAGVGQLVPLDAVQEYRLQANNMTAEFGRSGIVANVITKSGTNDFHGSAWWFYRGAALSSSAFEDNALGVEKSNFVRNVFGATAGGSVIKDKFFYFGSWEGVRVRSSSSENFFVPTSQFLALSSASTQNFINAFGGAPASGAPCITASDMSDPNGFFGEAPLTDVGGTPIAGSTPLFCFTSLRAPTDAGGGFAQNTWLFTGRTDYQWGAATRLSGRYAFEQGRFPTGAVSLSPYEGFNTSFESRNQNINLTLTHSFSPTVFSESRGVFNRIFENNPLGEAPPTSPCWFYDLQFNDPRGMIAFPGYVPDVCVFAGIPFGGPQNVYQGYQGVTWVTGKHTIKAGVQHVHLRDNRTFGAFENGFFNTFGMQGFIDGDLDLIILAIDPNGKFPGDVYDTAIDGAFRPPSFTRHFRYNEWAGYIEDSWKIRPRLTLDFGMRYEYFGVLHSPFRERRLGLDANLFLGAVGNPVGASIFELVRDARFSRTNNLFQQDFNNFGPRLGFAWDIFGTGRTVLRGGYGLFYDRNFGNVLFNVIQNFPNYAVITLFPLGDDLGGSPGPGDAPIFPNQFDSLAALGGGALTISGSSRMLNRDMVTAYSAQWNLTVQHDLWGKGIVGTVSYVGANGHKLYSLNNLNPRGGCVRAPTINPTCVPTSSTFGRLNQTRLTGMNRRANEGLSRYNALQLDVSTRRQSNTGLMFKANYTWAHSIDNSSSFFGDSEFEALFGFGFRNPYDPAFDRGDSSNDIRHRGTVSWDWQIPWTRNLTGAAQKALDGWSVTGVFTAQTGGAFTVYDDSSSQCTTDGTNFCFPLMIGGVPGRTETPSGTNVFTLYDVSSTFTTQEAFCSVPNVTGFTGSTCTAYLNNLFPELLSPRNLFRTPGIWNTTVGLLKNTRIGEKYTVQFRAEFFNIFNHANLFGVPGTNHVTGTTDQLVLGEKLGRRNIQLALKFLW